MNSLAELRDVESALGRTLTESEAARVEPIIAKASALFRAESGQLFTPGESDVRLKVNGGDVYLRQGPVADVIAVTDDDGAEVPFTLHGRWVRVPRASHEFVRVLYTHGGEVPDLVRLTVAEVAARALRIDPRAVAGASQGSETVGPASRSVTFAAWAQGGQTLLSPEDKAVARSFRVRVPTVWVQRP